LHDLNIQYDVRKLRTIPILLRQPIPEIRSARFVIVVAIRYIWKIYGKRKTFVYGSILTIISMTSAYAYTPLSIPKASTQGIQLPNVGLFIICRSTGIIHPNFHFYIFSRKGKLG